MIRVLKGENMAAQKYQYGNLSLRKRRKGPDVWQFRWTENGRQKIQAGWNGW